MAQSDSDEDCPNLKKVPPPPTQPFSIENLLGRREPTTCVRWPAVLHRSTNYFSGLNSKQICPIPPNILVPKDLFERDKSRRTAQLVSPKPSKLVSPVILHGNSSEVGDSDDSDKHLDDEHPQSSATIENGADIKMEDDCPRYKKKRPRTAFSVAQIRTLEAEFERNRYLTGSKRKELSKQLKLSETQIKIWFQNRRTKLKRKNVSEMETWVSELYSPLGPMAPRPLVIGDQLYLFNSPASDGATRTTLPLPVPCLHLHPQFDSCRSVRSGSAWPSL